MSAAELDRVLRLSPSERLQLIGQLWDSLVGDGAVPDLSPAQKDEQDARLDRVERDGSQGLPWPEVRRKIEQGEPLS